MVSRRICRRLWICTSDLLVVVTGLVVVDEQFSFILHNQIYPMINESTERIFVYMKA